jgi:hypothetical protein
MKYRSYPDAETRNQALGDLNKKRHSFLQFRASDKAAGS